MALNIGFIVAGIGLAFLALFIYATIQVQRARSERVSKWESLPRFKVYCDLMYQKQSPFMGPHLLPETLWWLPMPPMYGESREEMRQRCERYNQEPELCQ